MQYLTLKCFPVPVLDLLLPENRRRLPLEEQLQILQVRFEEVSSGKHSIGRSRRAKALRKEMTVIKRKLAHQREGGDDAGVPTEDRVSALPHHVSVSTCQDDEESSSQEKGSTHGILNVNSICHFK